MKPTKKKKKKSLLNDYKLDFILLILNDIKNQPKNIKKKTPKKLFFLFFFFCYGKFNKP